jgi:hypothetical protein
MTSKKYRNPIGIAGGKAHLHRNKLSISPVNMNRGDGYMDEKTPTSTVSEAHVHNYDFGELHKNITPSHGGMYLDEGDQMEEMDEDEGLNDISENEVTEYCDIPSINQYNDLNEYAGQLKKNQKLQKIKQKQTISHIQNLERQLALKDQELKVIIFSYSQSFNCDNIRL